MDLIILFLYLLIIISSLFVILSKNPVQSILFLILVYLFSACLFIFLGAEFLAILIFIIYVGAISVLFLFVVMLLNLRTVELFDVFFNYFPVGGFLGLFFFLEIYYIFCNGFFFSLDSFFFEPNVWVDISIRKSNLLFFGIVFIIIIDI